MVRLGTECCLENYEYASRVVIGYTASHNSTDCVCTLTAMTCGGCNFNSHNIEYNVTHVCWKELTEYNNNTNVFFVNQTHVRKYFTSQKLIVGKLFTLAIVTNFTLCWYS